MKLLVRTAGRDSEGTEMEQCVLCRRMTDVRKSRPVTERKYYIQGAGQLCEACYYRVYGPDCSA